MDKSKEQLEKLRCILENLTCYLESDTDITKNWVIANDVFEYIDEMWKVLGVNNTKEEREKMEEEMRKWDV